MSRIKETLYHVVTSLRKKKITVKYHYHAVRDTFYPSIKELLLFFRRKFLITVHGEFIIPLMCHYPYA